MARIPTVAGSSVIAAPVGAVQLNAGALMGPGQGAQGLAKGLQDVSQTAQEFEARKLNAINAAAITDASVRMKSTFASFQEGLRHIEDEGQWATEWQKTSDKLQKDIFSDPKLSPAARDHISNQFRDFDAEANITIRSQASKREVQRAKAKFENAADFAIQNLDLEGAKQEYAKARNAGLIFPEEEAGLIHQASQKVDFFGAKKAINDNPIAASEALDAKAKDGEWANFKNLDEANRLALSNQARTATEQVRAETVQGFQNRINNAEFVNSAELQSAVDAKRLTPQQMKWLVQQQSGRANYADAVYRMVGLTQRIDQWKPGNADSDAELHRITADMAGLPREMQTRLESDLQKAAAPTVKATDKPSDGYEYIKSLLNGGFFGPIHGEVEETKKGFFGTTKTKRKVTKEEAQAAYTKSLQVRDALKAAYEQNRHMTAAQQAEFVNGMIQGQTDLAAATPVLNSFSGRAQSPQGSTQTQKPLTRAEYDALPPGSVYTGKDGRQYTKGSK